MRVARAASLTSRLELVERADLFALAAPPVLLTVGKGCAFDGCSGTGRGNSGAALSLLVLVRDLPSFPLARLSLHVRLLPSGAARLARGDCLGLQLGGCGFIDEGNGALRLVIAPGAPQEP